ncbi:MAG: hypothetical protein ACI9AT_000422 [Ulvibacter sp.]
MSLQFNKTSKMGMYSLKSYKLTKEEYNYLLPVLRDKLLYKGEIDRHYFCGDTDELFDMLSRLKGLYGYFDSYNGIIDCRCAKVSSLEPFRDEMNKLKLSVVLNEENMPRKELEIKNWNSMEDIANQLNEMLGKGMWFQYNVIQ